MMPPASGSRAPSAALASTIAADCPPTRTRAAPGAGTARTALASLSPAPDSGSTAGTTLSHVPPRAPAPPAPATAAGIGRKRAKIGGAAEAGRARRPPAKEPRAVSTRAAPGACDSAAAYSASCGSSADRPGAATPTPACSWLANSARMTSADLRVTAPFGSTRSSGYPNLTPRNGAPSTSRTTMTAVALRTGRRMTAPARRCQNPSAEASMAAGATPPVRRGRIDSFSNWGPSTASTAGRVVTAARAATATTAAPAKAKLRRK